MTVSREVAGTSSSASQPASASHSLPCAGAARFLGRSGLRPTFGRYQIKNPRRARASVTQSMAAWCHDVQAARHILTAGRPRRAGPRATSPTGTPSRRFASPPEMGWFPLSMADQGRPDLTREVALIGAPRRLPRRRAQPTRSGRLSAAGSLEPGVDFRRPAPSQRGSRPRRGTRRGHPVFDPGTTNHVPRLTPTRFARALRRSRSGGSDRVLRRPPA